MNRRDIGQEILDGLRAIKRGECHCYTVITPHSTKLLRQPRNIKLLAFIPKRALRLQTSVPQVSKA